jgi:hypothetical protein
MISGFTSITARAFDIKFVANNMVGALRFRSLVCANIAGAARSDPAQPGQRICKKIDLRLPSFWKFPVVQNRKNKV